MRVLYHVNQRYLTRITSYPPLHPLLTHNSRRTYRYLATIPKHTHAHLKQISVKMDLLLCEIDSNTQTAYTQSNLSIEV